MYDAITLFGLSLHQIGINCCDKGNPVDKGGFKECFCIHTIKVEENASNEEPKNKDPIDEDTCSVSPYECSS